jgi:hypothetical protein
LLTAITFYKDEQKFNKNLEIMTIAIKAQLPKYVAFIMMSKEINLAPPLEMGKPPPMD